MGVGINAYKLTIDNCLVENNTSRGIMTEQLTMSDSIVRDNKSGGIYILSHMVMHSGTVTRNEFTGNGAGIQVDPGASFIMIDGEISENKALGSSRPGGGVSAHINTVVEIQGGSIRDNTALSSGAGIYSIGTVIISDGTISGNISGSSGGGVEANALVLEGGIIRDNMARFGGGIAVDTSLEMTGGTIEGNSSSSFGGGLFLQQYTSAWIYGGSFIDNATDGNGGAIAVASNGSLANIEVKEDVVFSGNTAGSGYFMTDPSDIALHNEKILTKYFSAPFTQYAYNNYDISYTKGINIDDAVAVSFYLTKSSGEVYESSYAAPGSPLVDFPDAPVMEGYQFLGWYDADGNLFDDASIITENISLYAGWIIL